jgi:protein-S-isoprenylcysteine O-methyltransferase Ste14
MLPILSILIFTVGSLAILWVSWPSLPRWWTHGFWRFFAFETILALIVLNLENWFADPFAPHQLVSWFLLSISPLPVLLGVRALRSVGKPSAARVDPGLLGFERTTQLVTVGIYRYIRHPLYGSLLLLAWGVFFKSVSWGTLVLILVATAALLATALAEEGENCQFFGPAYRAYMTRTKRFIPFVV